MSTSVAATMAATSTDQTCPEEPPADLRDIPFFTTKYPWLRRHVIDELIKGRKVCAYRPGGKWLISEAHMAAYIASTSNLAGGAR